MQDRPEKIVLTLQWIYHSYIVYFYLQTDAVLSQKTYSLFTQYLL